MCVLSVCRSIIDQMIFLHQVYQPDSVISVTAEKDNCSKTTLSCDQAGQIQFQQNTCAATGDQVLQLGKMIMNLNMTNRENTREVAAYLTEEVDKLDERIQEMNKTIGEQIENLGAKISNHTEASEEQIIELSSKIETLSDRTDDLVDGLNDNMTKVANLVKENIKGSNIIDNLKYSFPCLYTTIIYPINLKKTEALLLVVTVLPLLQALPSCPCKYRAWPCL